MKFTVLAAAMVAMLSSLVESKVHDPTWSHLYCCTYISLRGAWM